jgi:hypothetical protein
MKGHPHQLLWLGLWGSIAWIVVELTSPTRSPTREQEPTVVAWVDGVPIDSQRYFRVLASVTAQDNGPELNSAIRRTVLDDLIAEELLLARALSLDLPRNAPMARRHLVAAMTQLAQAEPSASPDETTLRAYFHAHKTRFRTRKQVQIVRMIFKDGTQKGEKRAHNARKRLVAGETFESVKNEVSDKSIVPLPNGLMPPSTLRHYVGPTTAKAVAELSVGEISEILPMEAGFQLIKLVAENKSPEPDFEDVALSVRSLFEREEKASALRRHIGNLRDQADIRINDALVENGLIPREVLSQARAPLWDAGPRALP